MYGRSRLGIYNTDMVMATQDYNINGYNNTGEFNNPSLMYNTKVLTSTATLPNIYLVYKGKKQLELSNHLENVLATLTDRRIARDDNGDLLIDYYNADISSTSDYYAFGSAMPGREIGNCMYKFNGKKTDLEAGTQDYGFRIYNPSLGKFLSVDPLTKDYPWYTPYQFAGNMPIWAIDLDGAEEKIVTHYFDNIGGNHKTWIKVLDETGPLGHGTLHKYIKHDWVNGKSYSNGAGYTWWKYEIKDYKYKEDYFEKTSYLQWHGNKLDRAYNKIAIAGSQAGSGGIGTTFKLSIGALSFSLSIELFGNNENSMGLNLQFDAATELKFKYSDKKLKTTLSDYFKISGSINPYVFLSSNSIESTNGDIAFENKSTIDGGFELTASNNGLKYDNSRTIGNSSVKHKIGPVMGVKLDLSKKFQPVRQNTSTLSGGFTNKSTFRFTTDQLFF